jgi:glycosyl transferase, family 25
MKRIIEYFDRSYIINLSDRTDRRRQVEREFRSAGISIPSEKVQFYTANRPTNKGGFINIGTRGNFESNRGVLGLAEKDRLQNVLIFEDDVCFRSVGDYFQRELLGQLTNQEWDVMYFGYAAPPDDGLTGPLLAWQQDILGTHFYAVNGRHISKMLQYMHDCELRPRDHPDGGPMTADGAYNHMRYVMPNVKVFLSVPNLAHQRSSRTDIAQTHLLDRIIGLRPIVRGLRAIKHRLRMAQDNKKIVRQLRQTIRR